MNYNLLLFFLFLKKNCKYIYDNDLKYILIFYENNIIK